MSFPHDISPGAMFLGDTVTLQASVTNLSSNAVVWTATAGTITQDGLYTAPNTPQTVTITAGWLCLGVCFLFFAEFCKKKLAIPKKCGKLIFLPVGNYWQTLLTIEFEKKRSG